MYYFNVFAWKLQPLLTVLKDMGEEIHLYKHAGEQHTHTEGVWHFPFRSKCHMMPRVLFIAKSGFPEV